MTAAPHSKIRTQTAECTIERLVHGGDGLGRLPEGPVVFVPWTAPGDRLRVEVAIQGNKRAQTKLLSAQVLQYSETRTMAPCSVFGHCGGCQWQHVPLEAQRHWKREIVLENLRRIGKLNDLNVLPLVSLDDGWRTRNKVQWLATASPSGGLQLAYHRAGSQEAIAFEHCHIIPERWNDLAHWLSQQLNAHPALKTVQVRGNRAGQWLLSLLADKTAWESISDWLSPVLASLRETFPEIAGVTVSDGVNESEPLAGRGYLEEWVAGKRFRVSDVSFFQINVPVAEAMVETVRNGFADVPNGSLVDLYAGVGLFSITLADRFSRVLAVESHPVAIQDAIASRDWNAVAQVELLAGSVQRLIPRPQQTAHTTESDPSGGAPDERERPALPQLPDETFDAGVVDPPRTGCDPRVLDWLSSHVSNALVYVSCDPATLARDLQRLSQQGWRVERIVPFDMFPQTYHVETVTWLRRG
jgi:23S rRNA (uracil1939-C5)-methyltransferase